MYKIHRLLGVALLGLMASGRVAAQVVHDPAPSGTEYVHDSDNGRSTVETPGRDAPVSDTKDANGKEHIDFDRDGHVGNSDMDHTSVDHDTSDHDSGDHDSGDHGGDHDGGDHGGDHEGGDHDGGDHGGPDHD